MTRTSGAMHVAKVSRKYGTASGPRESVSYLLRRTYRDEGKVKHETLANLSPLPATAIEAVRASLAGQVAGRAGCARNGGAVRKYGRGGGGLAGARARARRRIGIVPGRKATGSR